VLSPKRIFDRLVQEWAQVLGSGERPHPVALGIAVGIFWGFTPVVGLKTLLAVGTAWLCRGNKVAAAIGVTLHDLFLPLLPFLLRLQFQIGYWVLSSPHQFPPQLSHEDLSPLHWMHWTYFFQAGLPVLVGSLCMAFPASLITYAAALIWVRCRVGRQDVQKQI